MCYLCVVFYTKNRLIFDFVDLFAYFEVSNLYTKKVSVFFLFPTTSSIVTIHKLKKITQPKSLCVNIKSPNCVGFLYQTR